MASTKICKNCNSVIDGKAVICPACGVKASKPFYKRGWFILVVVLAAIVILGSLGNGNDSNEQETKNTEKSSISTTLDQDSEAPVQTTTPVKEQTTAATEALVDGMRPEFKEMMDEYEDFMEEYCAFMKKYQSSQNAMSMMADYMKFMKEYADFAEKIEGLDQQEMNKAELRYYTEVTGRVSKMLLEVAY